jgi:hypothetical protein
MSFDKWVKDARADGKQVHEIPAKIVDLSVAAGVCLVMKK